MSKTDLVRPSRDGDQFHYLWAARRCLFLLAPQSGLVAVTIEGASQSEAPDGEHVEAGEELIDVGEYYGDEDISKAERIAYIQLKHSTYRASEAWTPSGVEKTLRGFAVRYRELLKHYSKEHIQSRVTYSFISNRPISSKLLEAIEDAANVHPPRHSEVLKKLKKFTCLQGQALSDFCGLVRLEGDADGYWEQRNILYQDVRGYLSDLDVDAPVQLKDLVTRKALSESAENPAITRLDVLRALKVNDQDLFPAPCLVQNEPDAVPREQESNLTTAIMDASQAPIIVHADGGVGKSVFATRIGLGLPEGSVCVLYDCFGNGQYRNASAFRHRHKDAIPQIANELAGQGLCHPLIPTTSADSSAYLRAFLHRLEQSVTTLKGAHPNAVVCIVVDAADNAQMAAKEIGERRSFVRDLLRETLPEGVRLVALCRPHRLNELDPPPNALRLALLPFSRPETATFLRLSYPDATEHDVDEFHRLSSQNPRVQSLAVSWGSPLPEVLRKLGPNPTTVEDTIRALLDQAIAKLRDAAGSIEGNQIDRICTGLAALRPRVPIPVLASISGVDEAAIRSFAFDLGRPLIVTDGTIQFFDEPAEEWFRNRFKPKNTELAAFVGSLMPLASDSSYVASVLPQLMLEAGQYAELVSLALSSDALPENSPLERRDVELQRLQFALKASLRSKRYLDAAKLAMKAAGETAGDDRQRKLLEENTDLAAIFLGQDGILEVVSRKTFGTDWIGSHHAYEAGLLSGNIDLAGEARSRLRMAYEWLRNWSKLADADRKKEQISVEDIAEIAMAELNIHGAGSAAQSIRTWQPPEISFQAGIILAKRLVDHGRFEDLEELSLAAGNDFRLVLAITHEMRAVHRNPPKEVIGRSLRLVLDRRLKLNDSNAWDYDETVLHAVVTLVEAALSSRSYCAEDLVSVLNKHLPEEPRRGLASRHGNARFVLLRAYSLRAALTNSPIDLADLAHPELKKQLIEDTKTQSSREMRDFKEDIGALLPWHRLWAEAFLGRMKVQDVFNSVERTRAESGKARDRWRRDEPHISNEVAHLWLDTLIIVGAKSTEALDAFNQWVASLKEPLFTGTLTHIARLMARTAGFEEHSLEFVNQAFRFITDERDQADAKVESYVALSRAILKLSPSEAEEYFNAAVEVASKIGDEVVDRWGATIDLADYAAAPENRNPQMAYRLARCAELIYDYMLRDKYFDWETTVSAITGLCPSSGLAIASRWRDRSFGWPDKILRIVFRSLITCGALHPKTAFGLLPLRANWNLSDFLGTTLSASPSIAEKREILDFFRRYAFMDERDSISWRSIKKVCESHGLELPEIDDFICNAERREAARNSTDSNAPPTSSNANSDEISSDWDAIFADLDLTKSTDVVRSFERFRSVGAPYHLGKFFHEIFRCIPVGNEIAFIEAIGEVTSFGIFEYRTFFEQIPEAWKGRISSKRALAQLVRTVFTRYCMEITKSRDYQRFPLDLACGVSGLSELELIETVLSAIGEATHIVDANRLFTLVGLLAVKLTEAEAYDALSFTLDLLEDELEESDGDGPWSEELEPPDDIEETVAGYLWAALAAPQASYRWEAAHSIRGVCALGQVGVLSHLMRMLTSTGGGPFVDARLHFYELHARQWLLIAVARVAKESPAMIVPHCENLSQIALGKTNHILIREFAARAVLALMNSGHFEASPNIRKRLSEVNRSSLPTVQSEFHKRRHPEPTGSTDSSDDDRFYFGLDMEPYWFKPLGRCFDLSETDIARRANDVIRREWGYSGTSRWDDDERARRGVFKDWDTHHSHGSYPRVDRVDFYLSYHAMMTVAGRLLESHPLHHDPDNHWGDFEDWFSRHDLSRSDGSWLADRRDPPPLEWPSWKNETSIENWGGLLANDDFERVLFRSGGKISVWGYWTEMSGSRQETAHISSALVSKDRSHALLRALQTTANPYNYRIPDAGDEGEINHGDFQLDGWIIQQTNDYGIDRQDPWGGDIRFPPIRPAQFIKDLMELTPDPEMRIWSAKVEDLSEPMLWSQAWGHYRDRDDQEKSESGTRMEASIAFIQKLVNLSGKDLLIEVELKHQQRYSRHSHRDDEGLGYTPPSAKLFLIRGDGSVLTV